MMRPLFVFFVVTGCVVGALAGAEQKPPQSAKDATEKKKEAAPLVKLAPQASAKPVSALQYRMLPDPLDQTPGNAAPVWQLASEALRAPRKITQKEFNWGHAQDTALKDLPRHEVKAFLTTFRAALRLAHQAARRERCDWGMPPLTLQSIQEFLPLEGIQHCRELAALLGIQYRLQLAEGRYDAAAETLQTGFALARHLAESDMIIRDLVAIAIASIMLGHVEEWIQTPGSPNLYWGLTALPQPFLSVRRAVEHELNTIHRSVPRLRELRKGKWTEREVDTLIEQFFGSLQKALGALALGGKMPKELLGLQGLSKSRDVAKAFPAARRHLIDLGRPEKEADAMPKAQVVLIHLMDQYDQSRDDILKVLTLPSWQGLSLLEKTAKDVGLAGKTNNPILVLLLPALSKTCEARVRLERQMACFRCAEALRLYAANHDGKAPEKWSDVNTVPLPIDPATGKGLDAFYQVKNGRALLDVPPLPGRPNVTGRRFELTASPKK
jgi:hypothetical protein